MEFARDALVLVTLVYYLVRILEMVAKARSMD